MSKDIYDFSDTSDLPTELRIMPKAIGRWGGQPGPAAEQVLSVLRDSPKPLTSSEILVARYRRFGGPVTLRGNQAVVYRVHKAKKIKAEDYTTLPFRFSLAAREKKENPR